jgi:hypothetical protein
MRLPRAPAFHQVMKRVRVTAGGEGPFGRFKA